MRFEEWLRSGAGPLKLVDENSGEELTDWEIEQGVSYIAIMPTRRERRRRIVVTEYTEKSTVFARYKYASEKLELSVNKDRWHCDTLQGFIPPGGSIIITAESIPNSESAK